jgi:hypothetical protein
VDTTRKEGEENAWVRRMKGILGAMTEKDYEEDDGRMERNGNW